jgi:hypothetical protein
MLPLLKAYGSQILAEFLIKSTFTTFDLKVASHGRRNIETTPQDCPSPGMIFLTTSSYEHNPAIKA